MISRCATSATPGLAVTLALLWAMQALLDSGSSVRVDGLPRLPAVFTVPRRDPPPPAESEPRPDRIPPPVPLPETRTGMPLDDAPDERVAVGTGRGQLPVPGPGDHLVVGNPAVSDGPLISIVKVAPEYPPAAARYRMEDD